MFKGKRESITLLTQFVEHFTDLRPKSECSKTVLCMSEDGLGSPRVLGFCWFHLFFFLSWLKPLYWYHSSLLQLQLLENDRRLCLCISCALGMTFWCCVFSGTYLLSLGISVWRVVRNTYWRLLPNCTFYNVKMFLRGDKTCDSVSSNTHESFL